MKKVTNEIATFLLLLAILFGGYVAMQPTLLIAQSDTDEVQVNLTVTSGITLNSPADETMLPGLSVTQHTSTGSTTWTVITNDADGYTLTVHASTSPALQSVADQFADYTEAVENTPEAWSVSNAYEFGFGAFGTHVPDGTWGAGSGCDTGTAGSIPADINYQGFNGTTTKQIASDASETSQAGVSSTVCYAAEQETVFAPSGSYSAIVIATATVQ